MPVITAAMVKDLRERTGAGMMDCKEALNATQGDFEEAIKYLRKKIGGKLSTRERATAEGVIAVHVVDNQDAAIVELNSETDFVARNDEFKALARELAEQVVRARGHSVETVLAQPSAANASLTVQDRINDVFTKLREKIVFRRFEFISTDQNGTVAAYVHVPANDKIGVLVELEAPSPEAARSEKVLTLGKELAMQIAASRPRYMTREEVPAKVLEDEREIARTQARNEGRPEAALDKIVEGRVKKFYEDAVLLDQPYMREPKKTVSQIIKEAGEGISLRRYVRYEVGENIVGAATSGAIKEQAEAPEGQAG
ncbi:MAG TPA: translation elongation factor Ts [Chthonomonadaceae bacterium]|nr:translation elongation factor Ts [Chthonomonadaceae bacterium]